MKQVDQGEFKKGNLYLAYTPRTEIRLQKFFIFNYDKDKNATLYSIYISHNIIKIDEVRDDCFNFLVGFSINSYIFLELSEMESRMFLIEKL